MPHRQHQKALHARDGADVLKTKICCTIGNNLLLVLFPGKPQTDPYLPQVPIGKLVEGGMNVARLNMSHCDQATAATVIADLRQYLQDSDSTAEVAVWLDINGPKIRTGKLCKTEVYLTQGSEFLFVNDQSVVGDETKVSSTYTKELLKVGDKLFVDDGLLSFTVKERTPEGILCSVDNSGFLGEFKGINVPAYVVDEIPAVSANDAADISFAMKQNVDFITVSCIREIEDVQEVRLLLGNSKTKILAKIENKRGLENFEDILRLADGIVIDRGYLGCEVDVEVVTMEQKRMIMMANISGKTVMIANQMFESMKTNPRPTRSEAADTANAVMDGADGLVLSAETAIGKYVFESLDTMRRVASQAEKNTNYVDFQVKMTRAVPKPISVSESIASSAVVTANQVNAAVIIVMTELGGTARLVAKYRPQIPVVAATLVKQTARQLASTFGLIPFHHEGNDGDMIESAVKFATDLQLCKSGDIAVITSGQSVGFLEGTTTQMQLYTIP
ncbi:hypothetical protein HDU82_001052 [Entophlyctis luteolus]|nr:hypothetical protein HDU82_001052 [Entophlyctis luteolus]